jgi:murein L,D-transpeptidase YcbB/YkuD
VSQRSTLAATLAAPLATLLLAALAAPPDAAAQDASMAQPAANPVMEALRERVEAINASGDVTVEGEALRATRTLAQLYPMNGFQPLWDGPRLRELLKLIDETVNDGLTPADYHLEGMQRSSAQNSTCSPPTPIR